MKMEKRTMFTIAGLCSIISVLSYNSNTAQDIPSNDSNVKVVSAREKSTEAVRLSRMQDIAKTAEQQNISVAEVERQIAEDIIAGRRALKELSGGYGPGVHIVQGVGKDAVDANKIISVPIGGVVDFKEIAQNHKNILRPVSELKGNNTLYIKPIDIRSTGLENANLDGYLTSGTYLQGSGYAKTEILKNIEKTPTGKSGWTGITRVFSDHPTLGYVILEESDLLAGRVTAIIPHNSLNAKVLEYPATLAKMQDQSGRTMSDLNWIDSKQHSFSIKIQQTDNAHLADLMRLAENIALKGR